MIKNKYKPLDTIKERNGKIIERASQGGKPVVLKSYPSEDSKSIENELEVYQSIKQAHLYGFPQIKQGFQHDGRLYLVFEQLGHNLQFLRQSCGGRLSLKTTLMIGLQMLERIQFIHENGFTHGDIKPSNFLIGANGKLKHKVYLVDFQLSQPYIINGKHVTEQHLENFTGNLRFCGVGPNSQKTICRRDEVESWLYCLIFFLKGELPWMNIKASNMIEAYQLICAIKKQRKDQLLQGLPDIFANMLAATRALQYTDKPQYGLYRRQILGLMKKNGYELDYKHDWEYL